MTAAYMRYYAVRRPSVITIHNLAFQGQFPASVFSGLELPPHEYGAKYTMPDGSEVDWNYDTVKEIAKLLTVVVRLDRFSNGELLGAWESGLLGRITARAATLLGSGAVDH